MSTLDLEQRVKRSPFQQFVSKLAVVAADVIHHAPADTRLSRSRPADRLGRTRDAVEIAIDIHSLWSAAATVKRKEKT